MLVYLAPSIIGDRARGMFDLPAIEDLAARRVLEIRDVQRFGGDIRLMARVTNV